MKNKMSELSFSCSNILGSTVRNLSEENIGTIQDLMLDSETGEVAYVVLAVNTGFLNLSSKYFAIPWRSIFSSRSKAYIMDIDKEKLENAPGFDKDNWPNGPQQEFVDEINTYYGFGPMTSQNNRGNATQIPNKEEQEDFNRAHELLNNSEEKDLHDPYKDKSGKGEMDIY